MNKQLVKKSRKEWRKERKIAGAKNRHTGSRKDRSKEETLAKVYFRFKMVADMRNDSFSMSQVLFSYHMPAFLVIQL